MDERRFFIRLRGEALGPLSAAELRDLARRGGIGPGTPVAATEGVWVEARNVRGLVMRSGTAPSSPAGRCGDAFTLTVPRWLVIAGLLAVALIILGCGLMVVVEAKIPPVAPPAAAAESAPPGWGVVTCRVVRPERPDGPSFTTIPGERS